MKGKCVECFRELSASHTIAVIIGDHFAFSHFLHIDLDQAKSNPDQCGGAEVSARVILKNPGLDSHECKIFKVSEGLVDVDTQEFGYVPISSLVDCRNLLNSFESVSTGQTKLCIQRTLRGEPQQQLSPVRNVRQRAGHPVGHPVGHHPRLPIRASRRTR